MTSQEIQSKIESLYNNENSKGFYFHLINSFKQKKLKSLLELNEKSVCAITGQKITSIEDAIASEKSTKILSKKSYIELQLFSKKINKINNTTNEKNNNSKPAKTPVMERVNVPKEAFKKETIKKAKEKNNNKKFTTTMKLGDLESLKKLKEIYERGE